MHIMRGRYSKGEGEVGQAFFFCFFTPDVMPIPLRELFSWLFDSAGLTTLVTLNVCIIAYAASSMIVSSR